MKRKYNWRGKLGFTLMECLIAIMVFSIMASIITLILQAAIETHRSNLQRQRSLNEQGRNILLENNMEPDALIENVSVNMTFNAGGSPINASYEMDGFTAVDADGLVLISWVPTGSAAPPGPGGIFRIPAYFSGDTRVGLVVSSPLTAINGFPGLTPVPGKSYLYTVDGSPTNDYALILQIDVNDARPQADVDFANAEFPGGVQDANNAIIVSPPASYDSQLDTSIQINKAITGMIPGPGTTVHTSWSSPGMVEFIPGTNQFSFKIDPTTGKFYSSYQIAITFNGINSTTMPYVGGIREWLKVY